MLINVELAVKYVGCSRRSIYKWIEQGWLNDYRKDFHRGIRLDTRELDKFKNKSLFTRKRNDRTNSLSSL